MPFQQSCGQHCAVGHRGVLPFKSTIPGALTSSMVCLARRVRVVAGSAARRGAQVQIRTMMNKEVLRFWRLAPCDVEARVRKTLVGADAGAKPRASCAADRGVVWEVTSGAARLE